MAKSNRPKSKANGHKRQRESQSNCNARTEESTQRRYRKKDSLHSSIIQGAAKEGVAAKKGNGGRLPDKWLKKNIEELRSDQRLSTFQFEEYEIQNEIRRMESKEKAGSERTASERAARERAARDRVAPEALADLSSVPARVASGPAASAPSLAVSTSDSSANHTPDAPVGRINTAREASGDVSSLGGSSEENLCSYHGCPWLEENNILGEGWWRGFSNQNASLVASKIGKKQARNRKEHCNYSSFLKMSLQFDNNAVASGNARRLESPVHVNYEGEVVANVKDGYGHPVCVQYTKRGAGNSFYGDETGSNTNGKDDKNNCGERFMGAVGTECQLTVGIKDCHFTVTPITDANARLRAVQIIFKGKKIEPLWVTGFDVLVDEYDGHSMLNNFGEGKRYPGCELVDDDGNKVPLIFAATDNASQTSETLHELFKQLDKEGIGQRGTDEDGVDYEPFFTIDGHGSRMGKSFLSYICDPSTKWTVAVGCPYGTSKYQAGDHKLQNGLFKSSLYDIRRQRTIQKRARGLSEDMEAHEVVIIVKLALERSFLRRHPTTRALTETGMNPLNRAPLDDPAILATADDDVKSERTAILKLRGDSKRAMAVLPSRRNLLNEGSARLLGSNKEAASLQIAEAAETLNLNGTYADNLFNICDNARARNKGRASNNAASINLSDGEAAKRIAEAKRLSSGTVFANNNGLLNATVRDAVIARVDARDRKEASTVQKNKATKALALWKEVNAIKAKIPDNGSVDNLKVGDLKKLVQFKKRKSDGAMPSKKADLISRYNSTKSRASPERPDGASSSSEEDDEDDEVASSSDDESSSSSEESSESESPSSDEEE